jgi:hypothetical protein
MMFLKKMLKNHVPMILEMKRFDTAMHAQAMTSCVSSKSLPLELSGTWLLASEHRPE